MACWAPIVAAWAVVLVAVGVPGASAAARVVLGLSTGAGRAAAAESAGLSAGAWERLGWTVGAAVLIGVLAMAIGAGPAWLAARGRAWLAGIMLVPLLLPPYLAYSGWSLLRAPGTALGDWLQRAAERGAGDAPIVAGQVIAVVGLALWAWPLAMLAAMPSLARIDRQTLDQVRLEARGWRGVARRVRLALPGMAAGAGVVAVVMLGSAVPLHVAQIETDAIRLWLILDLTAAQHRWAVWVGAWPTVLIAGVAGVWLSGRLARALGEHSGTSGGLERPSLIPAIAGAVAWLLAVIVPLILFAMSIREGRSLRRFWVQQGEALADSATVGLWVGGVGGVMSLCVAYGLSCGGARGRSARALLAPLLVAAVLPGVLVGSATLDAWSWAGAAWVLDTPVIAVLAHLARFGAVAALAGVWLASSEPAELRALRRLEGATGPVGWVRATGAPSWMVAGGAGLSMGVLSLHEIEAGVIVHPPGFESIARHLLALLHFARDEQLSSAAVWLIGLGLIPAGAAVAMATGAWAIRSGRAGRATARGTAADAEPVQTGQSGSNARGGEPADRLGR